MCIPIEGAASDAAASAGRNTCWQHTWRVQAVWVRTLWGGTRLREHASATKAMLAWRFRAKTKVGRAASGRECLLGGGTRGEDSNSADARHEPEPRRSSLVSERNQKLARLLECGVRELGAERLLEERESQRREGRGVLRRSARRVVPRRRRRRQRCRPAPRR